MYLEGCLETNKMKFNEVLYLEGGKNPCMRSALGKTDLTTVCGKQTWSFSCRQVLYVTACLAPPALGTLMKVHRQQPRGSWPTCCLQCQRTSGFPILTEPLTDMSREATCSSALLSSLFQVFVNLSLASQKLESFFFFFGVSSTFSGTYTLHPVCSCHDQIVFVPAQLES